MDLSDLRDASSERARLWHDDSTEPWTGADWGNAMGGECGEAQNVVKKLRRVETRVAGPNDETDVATLVHKLAMELADTIIYADLLALHYGIDLSEAVAEKFNIVSEKRGFTQRLQP